MEGALERAILVVVRVVDHSEEEEVRITSLIRIGLYVFMVNRSYELLFIAIDNICY